MKVTKYYCDICKIEVADEESLTKIPYIEYVWDEPEYYSKEVCEDCIVEISKFLRDERMKK